MWTCPRCGRDFKNTNQEHSCGIVPSAIDEYIGQAPDGHREALRRVRETIRETAPDAQEKISWRMPTFWQGENLIHFAAFKNHLGLYPGEEGVRMFAERLRAEGYNFSKGAIQFPWSKSIPYELIAEITRFRVNQVAKKTMRIVKYIALLRGVNVGGNNKVSMPELKTAFEEHGFLNVTTYINSGNILFDSDLDKTAVRKQCEELIEESFGQKITVCVILSNELLDAVKNAPTWWNAGADSKHNVIFVVPPMTPKQICSEVGEVKPKYENVMYYGSVIFWSAPLATFSHTRWSKITKKKTVYEHITIRNANTILKLAELVKGI